MPTERAAVVAALNWSAEKTSQKAAARVHRQSAWQLARRAARRPCAADEEGWRIGYLTGGSAEREKSWLASFRQGLRELGYVEGEGEGGSNPHELALKGF